MHLSSHQRHPRRIIAILLGVVVAAVVCIGLPLHFKSASSNTQPASTDSAQQSTFIMHDRETLNSTVIVPEGTTLVVKSDQENRDANVQVADNGGFIVENGAVLVLENVNFSGDGNNRSTPVFSVYGDMVMNDGAVGNFSSTSAGSSSDYGEGGVPAICVIDGTFTMNDGVISGNSNTTTKAIAFGGALRAEGKDASVTINGGTISGNKVLSSAAVFDDLTVSANALGGAIAITQGASLTLNGGEISNNTAGSHDVSATSTGNSVCAGNGGAIAVYSSDSNAISSIYVDGGSIENNNAYRTGGDNDAYTSVENLSHGGGIFSNVYTKAVFNSGKIVGNTSDDRGGGMFLDCGKAYGGAKFKNTLVSGNVAEILGGGLWFCPTGESYMFSDAKADGVAVFDNTTTNRSTDGAGDDLYVTPRSENTGVTLTATMLGGGSNAWYEDGGAESQMTSNRSVRYSSSDAEAADTLLQADAIINTPSAEARGNAIESATVVVADNSSSYGGGIASNQCLIFGTPTPEEEEEYNLPPETPKTEKIDIDVTKTWIGDASTSATVHLFANGSEVASATLSADDDWAYTFEDLDKTDSDGNDIVYTLTEDEIDGYDSVVSGNASDGFVVTNTNTATIDISGTKVWDDSDDQDGVRPDSVTVSLLQDDTVVDTATVTADDDGTWSFTFEDVLVFDATDGHEYTYTIEEADVPDDYTAAISGDADSGFTITNTHTPETTSVSVSKVWNDADDQDGKRPDSVTVQLYANGQASGDVVELSDDNSWAYTWESLDKYANGQEITYTVAETDVLDGYTSDTTDNENGTFTITNTHTPETTSVSVTKSWNDNDDQDGKRPDSVTVQLYANGTASGDTVALSSDNSWTNTWSELDAYANGQEIAYTVTETSVPTGYSAAVSGDAASGFTITNTHTPETISVPVEKVWVGSAGTSATIALLADGTTTGKKLTLSADTNWSGSFTELDKYNSGTKIAYTISESGMSGVNSSDYSTDITGTASNGFTVTNTQLIDIPVTKQWFGGEGSSATVHLYADGTEVANTTLTTSDGWTHTFTDLPKYNSDGEEIDYTLSEDQVEGYSSTVTENTDGSFTVKNISDAEVGVRVVKDWRGMPETVTVNLYGSSGSDDAALVESVTLDGVAEELSSDSSTGIEYGEDDAWVAVFTGLPKYDSQTGTEITYSVTENAVSETSSVISEPTTEGDVTTFTITNTRSATFQPTVTKEWDDGVTSEQVTIQLLRGDDVVDEITLDGEPDEDAVASDTESSEYTAWQGRFKAVDKFDDHGAPISYTVNEVTTGDWQSTISGNERIGFTIQNAPLGSTSATLAASKTVNGGDVGGSAFSFELYEGASATGTPLQTVQNDHDGAVAFDPIVYTTSGTRTYTIVEKDEGATDVTYDSSVYTVTVEVADANSDGSLDTPTITYYKDDQTVSAATFDNTVVTRTSVSFTKEWIGEAGESATVHLMCSTDGGDAEDTGLSVTVDGTIDDLTTDSATSATYGEDAAWHGTFQNLVASDREHTYSYTLVEDAVDGYASSSSGDASEGYVFTNAELISIPVTKEWIGPAGTSATFALYADGVDTGQTLTLTADDSWSGSFVNLAKYSNGTEVVYTVYETGMAGVDSSNYSTTSSGSASEGYTFTNTNTETVDVSGSKVWDDNDDQDGLRPDSVTVNLLRDGSVAATTAATADGDWSFSFDDLAKYDSTDGHEYTYAVAEATVPDGYTSSVSGYTITNSHTPEQTSVTVSKTWDDGDDQDGLRPDSVSVQLYAGGTASGSAVELNDDNN